MKKIITYLLVTIWYTCEAFSQCAPATYDDLNLHVNPGNTFYVSEYTTASEIESLKSKAKEVHGLSFSFTDKKLPADIYELIPLMTDLEMLEINKDVEFSDTTSIFRVFESCKNLSHLTFLKLNYSSNYNSIKKNSSESIPSSVSFSSLYQNTGH